MRHDELTRNCRARQSRHDRKRWLTEQLYTEFIALAQCLPGPSSSQISFAIGIAKKGVRGGLMTGGLFLSPGALMMMLLGV